MPSMKFKPKQAHRTDERAGKQAGLEMAEQFHELVEHADPRTAGVDETRHALIDADGIGIGKAERPIGVDVDVHPAGAQIVAGHIDDLGAGGGIARTDMLYLAAPPHERPRPCRSPVRRPERAPPFRTKESVAEFMMTLLAVRDFAY